MLAHESARGASVAAGEGVITADMVAQHAYCPRRLYLAYAEGRWEDNAYTDHGRWVHRNADRSADVLAAPGDLEAPRVARSVELESTRLGLRAKLDLLEQDGASGAATPVEVKRAVLPPGGVPYPPERLQVAVQAVLLRENGCSCDEGVVYYAGSKTRVPVPITRALEEEVLEAVDAVRGVLALDKVPAPLQDSPKCVGCSLVGICLPDETNLLRGEVAPQAAPDGDAVVADDGPRVRRLVTARDDALPLYVQEQGAQVGKRGELIVVSKRGETLGEVRLLDVSEVVLCGNVMITPQAVHLLCESGVPITHLSAGHWYYGVTSGLGLRNAFDRAAQFRRAEDAAFCLELARAIVTAKGKNQRTLLRRNGPSDVPVLDSLRDAIDAVAAASTVEELLGAEGRIAALYFGGFSSMLRPTESMRPDGGLNFDFNGRNRRPPRDPVNAMLSFGYALLAKEATVALLATGLDPHWGVYHRPRHGRPALALDLMEEFRPLLVDSAVLTAVNTGAVDTGCFESGASGCAMNARGRKAFLGVFEARLDQLMTHPTFDYRVSWRRTIRLQAQLLARVFRGELAAYPAVTTR
jgi:CRISPR-associated endonuclease Cas1/CRISPR-associated protein Cas4